jgi:Tfp pilus assembly protein PilW
MSAFTRTIYERGISLIELLVYVAFLALIIVVVANAVLSISRSYSIVKVKRAVDHGAMVGIERITREVRGAKSIHTGESVLNSSPGRLTLNTTDETGAPATIGFYVQDGVLVMSKNGVYAGPLTSSSTAITSLVFRQLISTSSKAVKLEMTLRAVQGPVTEEKNYYSTVVMRGTY